MLAASPSHRHVAPVLRSQETSALNASDSELAKVARNESESALMWYFEDANPGCNMRRIQMVSSSGMMKANANRKARIEPGGTVVPVRTGASFLSIAVAAAVAADIILGTGEQSRGKPKWFAE